MFGTFVGAPVRWVCERIVITLALYRRIDDVQVGLAQPTGTVFLWGHVADAMALIRRLDHGAYFAVRNRARRILVLPHRATAEFWLLTRTIVLPQDEILKQSAGATACDLVHESVHARLNSLARMAPRTVARIEARCIREQIALARKLSREGYSNIDPYVEYLNECLRQHLEA